MVASLPASPRPLEPEQAPAHVVMQGGHSKGIDPVGAVIEPVASDVVTDHVIILGTLCPNISRTMDSISNNCQLEDLQSI